MSIVEVKEREIFDNDLGQAREGVDWDEKRQETKTWC